ncbi:MAG: PAS domain-containing protein, partial [Deinococcota bacterium]
ADLEDLVEARSSELRVSNERLAILNDTARQLNHAQTYNDVINVVLEALPETTVGGLFNMIRDAADTVTAIELIGNRSGGARTVDTPLGTTYSVNMVPLISTCLADPNSAIYMGDIQTDSRTTDLERDIYKQLNIGAQIFISLRQAGQTHTILNLNWPEPMIFSDEQRAYIDALSGLLSPVVNSLRSLENLAASNKHLALVNHVSNQLKLADDFDIVETLLEPIKSKDSVNALLMNVHRFDAEDNVKSVRVMSNLLPINSNEAMTAVPTNIGTVYKVEDFPIASLWLDNPDQTVIIEDTQNDPRLTDAHKASFGFLEVNSSVFISLRQSGQWLGLFFLAWKEPVVFSEDEKAYLAALPAMLSPVVANLQSLEGLARANNRLAQINKVSSALKAAETIDGVLETILEPLSDDTVVSMSRPIYDDNGTVTALEIVGNHSRSNRRFDAEVGAIYPVANYTAINWYLEDTDRVKLISDVSKEPRFDDNLRALQARLGIGAQAYITLKQAGNILAFVSVVWEHPHEFSEDEKAYFNALPALLSPVIANRQALDSLEQSNTSLATLNHLSNELKLAETADRMLEVVLEPLPEDVAASLFYTHDVNKQDNTTSLQLVSQVAPKWTNAMPLGTVIPANQLPSEQTDQYDPEKTVFIEDTANDPQLDESSKSLLAQFGVATSVTIPLYQSNEWLGNLSLSWHNQYTFSPTERAYLEALPGLLSPSIANRRMVDTLEETVARRSEELSRSRQLLRSTIDNASSIIFVKDIDGVYMLANEALAKLWNVTTKDIVGKTDHDFLPPEFIDDVRANDLEVMTSQQPSSKEEVIPSDNGDLIFMSTKYPLFDDAGNVVAVGCITTDITEQREKEREVQAYRDQLSQAQAELQ